MSDVALAAGFSSVRRFNEAMRAAFGAPPTELRRVAAGRTASPAGVTLRLPFRPPFDSAALVAFLGARAIPGVESVDGSAWRRTAELAGVAGTVEAEVDAARSSIVVRLFGLRPGAALDAARRAGRLFDTDADPAAIAAHLGKDPLLAPLVELRPGLRVPGAWDPFETAVRTVLGQQVSVKAARTLAARLVSSFGRPLPPGVARGALTHLFPRPDDLAEADVASIGLPSRRGETIRVLAREVAAGRLDLGPAASLEEAERLLAAIPGVGPWTAQAIALRSLGEPDAFPGGDLGVRKALAVRGVPPTTAAAEARAAAWRPWRAYALVHLWTDLASREDS